MTDDDREAEADATANRVVQAWWAEAEPVSRVALVRAWWAEADEREARAANPEVVGLIERLTEEAVVRTLRRCAAALRGGG